MVLCYCSWYNKFMFSSCIIRKDHLIYWLRYMYLESKKTDLWFTVLQICDLWDKRTNSLLPGHVAQSCLTEDPGVASSIPAHYHTFVGIDHEIISTAILLPSADLRRVVASYKRKYYLICARLVLVNRLVKLAQEKSVVKSELTIRSHDHSCWLGRKDSNQLTNKTVYWNCQ